jgi:hypothetical protein
MIMANFHSIRLEKHLEAVLVSRVKKIGGKCIKMVPTFEAGIPDRQVLYKGRAVFVELKAKGKKPRKLQINYMKELELAGFEVRVIDSMQGVNALIDELVNEKRSRPIPAPEGGRGLDPEE